MSSKCCVPGSDGFSLPACPLTAATFGSVDHPPFLFLGKASASWPPPPLLTAPLPMWTATLVSTIHLSIYPSIIVVANYTPASLIDFRAGRTQQHTFLRL